MKIRLAVIGCGAISQMYHIPIALASEKVEMAMLVDSNLDRAKAVATKFDIHETASDYRQIFGKVDAAILAVPHHLHAPIAVDLLNHGTHVLVEKPMALSTADCDRMIAAAKLSGATIAVGLVRRFLRSHQSAKQLISEDFLGTIESFDVREGSVYDWPVASDFFFKKESGGGVLADMGAHALDTVLWWLGDCELIEYRDDSMGGVEANCEIHLRTTTGANGVVQLSRTHDLRNTLVIRGEKASLEVEPLGSRVCLQSRGSGVRIIGNAIDKQDEECGLSRSQSVEELMEAQLEDWVQAIESRREPCVTAREGARSVALIETCYKNRAALRMPWLRDVSARQGCETALKGKRVLVVGGTGFIGGHLIESLVTDHGADVRALVRNFARAQLIARFPIDMISGDVTDLAAVERAAEGCDTVFHCAYGNRGNAAQQVRVTIQGTENVLKAALKHGLRRVVYVSTVSVYGKTKDGDLDESAPRKRSNDVYADSKLKAEELVFDYSRKYDVPVSIIQPTVVYGPYAPIWTVGPIHQLRTGRVILVDGGNGLCNAVYVDDVVRAMIIAAVREEALGQAFLVSAAEPVTWRVFYRAYERLIGNESTISMTLSEIMDFRRRYRREHSGLALAMMTLRQHPDIARATLQIPPVGWAYRLARLVTPTSLQKKLRTALTAHGPDSVCRSQTECEKPILPITDSEIEFFRVRTRVRIDKAQELLGYQPQYDLDKGMAMTEKWLRFSQMI